MAIAPAITDLDQLKDRPEVAALMGANRQGVTGAKFDRNELSIYVDRSFVREAVALLRDHSKLRYTYLADVTCADWYPNEPRFEVAIHLLSMANKQRVRLKVQLHGDDAAMDSLTAVFPSANFFEREVFDLFGIRFEGHPFLRRIMMPDDWKGHPLRKDYPVEGYR
jgi:NADH-quinone oxidoreductase subunit C